MISKLTSGYAVDKLLANGAADLLDLISGAAFTTTGGVANTWPGDSSNFRTLLGAQAPVIAQACDNLLPDEDASFETGIGTWSGAGNCTFASWQWAVKAYHGTHSARMKTTANGAAWTGRDLTAITTAGLQYTLAIRFMGVAGRTYMVSLRDGVAANTDVYVIATGASQTIVATKTMDATSVTRMVYLYATDALAGDEVYWDAAQVELGAVQTPFALGSRTASTMSIPTATIGLTPGMPLTIMAIVNTPYIGADGLVHFVFTTHDGGSNSISLYKGGGNNLIIGTSTTGPTTKIQFTTDVTAWTANTNHVLIATLDAANTQQVFLDGVAGISSSGVGAREVALGANYFVGTDHAGTEQLNGSILTAVWGRVLSAGEITALSSLASWNTLTDITISGVSAGNAGRIYSGVTLKDSGVETGGIITLTPAGASRTLKVFEDDSYVNLIDSLSAADIWGGDTYGLAPDTTSSLKFVDYEWSVHNGAEGNILLDLNDGTDFCLDEIAFPIPKPRIEWRDPAHGDGRDVSRSKYENREIRLTLQIFGTNETDLSTNARALWAMLASNSILAFKSAGWADTLYFDLISPALEINTPEWFETWIRENGKLCVMSNVEIVVEAKPFARSAEETVTLLDGTATPNGVSGMVIAPTAFKGDVPAPADIFIDLVSGTRWTDLIFGQRLNYSPAFQPIRQPTVGTVHALASRLSGDYYSIAPRVDLLDDGIFAQHGVTSGNTTDWDHWTETRSTANAWMSTEASPVYTGTHSVKVGNSAETSWLALILISDSIAVSIAKTYLTQLVYGHSTYPPYSAKVSLSIQFYNGATYLSEKTIFTADAGGGSLLTSWRTLEGYVSPADFPAATTHCKVRLHFYTDVHSLVAHYAYFGKAVFAEVVGGTIQAEYLLSSHEGRYLPTSSLSFDASAAFDDVTLQALLATSAGVALTPSISPQVIDPGNPNTNFIDMSMLPVSVRPSVLSIPSHRISNLADKSDIEQVIRLSIDPQNLEDFWYDYVGIVPIDRAYSEVRNWANSDHLILDGRSSQLALQSLTGSLDDAMIYPITSQKGDCTFVADPDGFNGTIIALQNVDGDYQVTSVIDVRMKYFPLYLIVPEG